MSASRLIRRLTADLLLWYCLPAVFLGLYVGKYAGPTSAVGPHLIMIALPFAALGLVRLALANLVHARLVRELLVSVLAAALLALMILYYAFVLIGLESWGGVVSRGVIPAYFEEGPAFADALGLSPGLLATVLALALAALLLGCWLYVRRFDWTTDVRAPGWMVALLVGAGLSAVTAEAYTRVNSPWSAQGEPISLTLAPLAAGVRELEGHAVSPQTARRLDALDDAARAAYVPAVGAERRNVIVIVVDALRADHMGIFGYARDTTPNLERLERAGDLRKMIVHASCGDTICGLLSLFGSKFPTRFSLRAFSLHEVLRQQGYRVHLILGGDHTHFYSLRTFYGPVDSFFDGNQVPAPLMNDDRVLVRQLAGMPDWDGVPAMFQFHLMSVHVLRASDGAGPFAPWRRYLGWSHDTGPGGQPQQSAVNFYDNGVVDADTVIAELLGTLERKGYLRNALVVITADHGESLGEHGLVGHRNSVREELLRIPLVLIAYGYQPARPLDTQLLGRQTDIAPTILADLGMAAPRTWDGRALQSDTKAPFAYFEEHGLAGLIDARAPDNVWKYWVDRSSGREHVFDLTRDPHENHDVVDQIPAPLRAEWRAQALAGTPLLATVR